MHMNNNEVLKSKKITDEQANLAVSAALLIETLEKLRKKTECPKQRKSITLFGARVNKQVNDLLI